MGSRLGAGMAQLRVADVTETHLSALLLPRTGFAHPYEKSKGIPYCSLQLVHGRVSWFQLA